MQLINLYLDKNSTNYDNLISILRTYNIDFMETRIINDKETTSKYNLESIPALRFNDKTLYNPNELNIYNIIEPFNSYIDQLERNDNSIENQKIDNTQQVPVQSCEENYKVDDAFVDESKIEPLSIELDINKNIASKELEELESLIKQNFENEASQLPSSESKEIIMKSLKITNKNAFLKLVNKFINDHK